MDKVKKIGQAIHRYYEQKDIVSPDLIEAILYSVDAGGKRVRPLIFLELLEGFGVVLTDAHYDVAAALEMIHTGSLIHDDLPAMDNDDYRRGRLTNHKKFNEATAILAGDSLFLDPYEAQPLRVTIDSRQQNRKITDFPCSCSWNCCWTSR